MRWQSLSSQRFTHYGCEIFVSRPGFFPKSTPNERRYLHGSTTFLRRVYRTVFFPHGSTPFFRWMFYELSFSALMSLFSRGALQVNIIFFIVQNFFFRRRTYRDALFSTSMERRFPFRVVFFRLDQRPFFGRERLKSSSFPQDPSFFIDQRTFPSGAISLQHYFLGFCDNLKYQNFRLIVPFHFKFIASFLIRLMDNFKLIASSLIRLMDNFKNFLFSDIYDIHTYMHTLFSHIRF